MTNPISAILSGSLTGATKQGALTPVPLAYILDAQEAHHQFSGTVEVGETKPITIPTNLAGPVATPREQAIFIVTCDVPGVSITLNASGVAVGPFAYSKSAGVLLLPGLVGSPAVPVSDISIVNSGTQRATFTVTAIYGA
jgi:hypothetical protein